MQKRILYLLSFYLIVQITISVVLPSISFMVETPEEMYVLIEIETQEEEREQEEERKQKHKRSLSAHQLRLNPELSGILLQSRQKHVLEAPFISIPSPPPQLFS